MKTSKLQWEKHLPEIINFSSVLFNKGIGLVFPILLIPYLINTIGLYNYGKVAFIQVITIYLILIVDYGFNLYCIRILIANLKDENYIYKLFYHVIIVKVASTIFLCLVLFVFLFVINSRLDEYFFYFSSFLTVIGQSFLPVWLFQAKQQNQVLAGSTLLSKTVASALILSFIREPNDYIWIPSFLGLGDILSLLVFSSDIFWKSRAVKFDRQYICHILKDAKSIFISNFSIASYTNLTTIIASSLFTPDLVGIFSIGDKIANLSRSFIAIIIQYFYPKLCEALNQGKRNFKRLIYKLIKSFGPIAITLSITLFTFSHDVSTYFSSVKTTEISDIIKIFSFLPIGLFFLNLIPYMTLLANGKEKLISYIIIICSIIGLVILIIFSLLFGIKGIALSVIITEILVGVSLWILCSRTNLIS